jgi:hypothetical protein
MQLMVRTDEEAQIDWAVILDDRVLVSSSDYYIDPDSGQRQYNRVWYDQLIDLDGAGGVSSMFNATEQASRCFEAEPPAPEVRRNSCCSKAVRTTVQDAHLSSCNAALLIQDSNVQMLVTLHSLSMLSAATAA